VALLLSLASLGLGLGGCASERSLAALDPGLTRGALEQGGIAIVGVTMNDEVEQIRPPLNETLEKIVAASHPSIPLRSAEDAAATLGRAMSRRILFRFQQTGSLDDSSLASIAERLAPTARYALFARIEKSSIHPPGRPRDTEIRYGTVGANWSTRRDARVRFTLYDLRDRTIAMDATYLSSSENALPESLLHRPPQPRVIGPGESGVVVPDFSPETPSLADAITEACRAFAADLPRMEPPMPAAKP
jgi:hypothetical protein